MDLRVVGQQRSRELADRAQDLFVRWRRRLATMAMFVAAALFCVHVVFGSNGWAAYQKKRAENRQLQQELQKLTLENQQIEQHVKALRSDPKAIEKEAREQLHYARPDERIYVIPEQNPAPAPPAAGVAQKQPK